MNCKSMNNLKEIKSIWPAAEGWRISNGNVEFSLKISNGHIEWFSVHQAPERVQILILKLVNLGEKFDQ